ncbi:AraC family transcriptional regulator [Gottschalkia purinilytica]|uniref:AraC family transcriptional regulator n=1 Tax=Gottschalkia purinilytica TaxID=1503 RepID=A0A0L0W6B8_GOTPU|nr:AraC family transcriptional regulator [Gottschalkia purinilytica]KNF07064.1 AraC family transcriptional regulator [Gottschalkia purinilytica]
MNCNVCNMNYSQFIMEEKIALKLKSHDIKGALTAYEEFFSNNDFKDLGCGFYTRSLKNHMICLLVSLSRTLSINKDKCFNLKNLCNEYILYIEQENSIYKIIEIGKKAIINYCEILKKSHYGCENALINNAIEYIENNLNTPITLDAVARVVHVSKNYLSSLFFKKTGMKFTYFINYLRVSKAKELISTTSFSMCYIADLCGFKNQNYFSTIFKKYTQVSPAEYKKYYDKCV